ncbi:hypothetical protein [Streptomyces sp. 8N616]|uniref:hypothetical protein n=1 Tax=Streptomyces sp. 8N616 TaxID=3457414 RepID=UPI003FD4E2A4
MTTAETSRFVRLRVELVLEVIGPGDLTGAALDHIDSDAFMPEDERGHARAAVQEDDAEALAYLVDPFELVGGVPGVELAQASWSSEQIEYDPNSAEWDLGLDDEDMDEDTGDDEDMDEDGSAGENDQVGGGGEQNARRM